jgi:hypothetical protein
MGESEPGHINTSQIPPPTSLQTISAQKSHQHLSNRYVKIIEQTKSDMMAVYIASAEAHMHKCQVKFGTELAQTKQYQHMFQKSECTFSISPRLEDACAHQSTSCYC